MQGGRSRKGSAATNRSGFVTARCRAPLVPAEPHGEGMWALPGERELVGDGTERKVTRGRAEVEKWGWVGQERPARPHGAGGLVALPGCFRLASDGRTAGAAGVHNWSSSGVQPPSRCPREGTAEPCPKLQLKNRSEPAVARAHCLQLRGHQPRVHRPVTTSEKTGSRAGCSGARKCPWDVAGAALPPAEL